VIRRSVRPREARRAAEASEERANVAEVAAEEALAEVETAAAVVMREELAAARTEIDRLGGQVTALDHEVDHEVVKLTTERAELTAQLAAERAAETAERHAIRDAARAEQLATELTTARAQLEHWQAQAGDVRAGVCSELAAANVAVQTEKDHAAQRLADQQARYEELINELRVRLHQSTNLQAPDVNQDDR
jgi:chorismate mutase